MPLTEQLRAVTGRGADARGAVTIELDGTGRLRDVAITSTAMDGNRGSLERAFRDAHDAAWDDLERARQALAPQLVEQATAQVGDLVADARSLQAVAAAQMDRAIAAINAAAARATEGAS